MGIGIMFFLRDFKLIFKIILALKIKYNDKK